MKYTEQEGCTVIMTISRLFPGFGVVFTSRSEGELPVRTRLEFYDKRS